ncbi:MAG: class I SAM-dependent methyltransferase [Acidobacteria bacterium]|nr:class I SAM-dependent methyltransferase [Acidobacteriota bacterium]
MQNRHLHEENRKSWNTATRAHNSHKKDQAAFLRGGGSTLFPEEKVLLGSIDGSRLVHLQCNAGQDSLSLAALGAEVTGVDISDEAIDFARKLSIGSGIPTDFIRANVYDWFAETERHSFDVVFCSYGALCWLSDLDVWARGVAKVLRLGGRFVCIDFHPFSMVFDEHFEIAYPYFADGRPLTWDDGVGDYVGMAGEALAPSGFVEGETQYNNPHPVHEFQWAVAEVFQSLIDAGMTIEVTREYPYSNGAKLFEDLVEVEGRRFTRPEGKPNLPLMWGVVARKN